MDLGHPEPLVGRDRELATAYRVLSGGSGEPGTLVLLGEAGIGKTRLVREILAHEDRPVLAGRAVPGVGMPLRPLVEVASVALRMLHAREPDLEQRRLLPVLAHLTPAAGTPSPEVNAPILAEALVGVLGALRPLVVFEDLHWADPDTLAVVTYLADRAAAEGVTLLLTGRDDESSAFPVAVRDLAGRGVARLLALRRLPAADQLALAAAVLGLPDPGGLPAGAADVVLSRSDGVPLLIEGLVAQLAAGSVTAVPISFADTVRFRLQRLDPAARSVVRAAAVFGESFPHDLLEEVAERPGEILEALRQGIALGLLQATDGGFAFRHALTAAAVIDELLLPERTRLCGRAARAVVKAHPDLTGPWRALAADLYAGAGDTATAAELLRVEGEAALEVGALGCAVELLERSARLGPDPRTDLALLRAVVAAGDAERVAVVGRRLTAPFSDTSVDVRVSAEVLLARARLGVDPTSAATHLRRARSHATGHPRLLAEVDLADALSTLESPGPDRVVLAEQLARRAIERAEPLGLAEIVCDAWGIVGRCVRLRDLDAAEEAFIRQLAIADSHHLALGRIHALNELGTIDALRDLDFTRLREAYDAALNVGAFSLVTSYCINLCVGSLFRGDVAAARQYAERCEVAAERQGLTGLVDTARVWLAACAAHRGRRQEMEGQLARIRDHDALDVETAAWGLCRAMLALVEEDRARALAAYSTADALVRSRSPLMGDVAGGPRLLVQLVDRSAPADARPGDPAALQVRWDRMHVGFAAAVLAGRQQRHDEALAAFEIARAAARPYALHGPLYLRLVAEAAIDDGWGEPVAWLLEAEASFVALGLQAPSSACRALLRRCGVRVGRSGAEAERRVPDGLRRLGVTAREYEVLLLASDRLTNREIAERLHLSARTVEKHLAGLMTKLHAGSRRELAQRAHLVPG